MKKFLERNAGKVFGATEKKVQVGNISAKSPKDFKTYEDIKIFLRTLDDLDKYLAKGECLNEQELYDLSLTIDSITQGLRALSTYQGFLNVHKGDLNMLKDRNEKQYSAPSKKLKNANERVEKAKDLLKNPELSERLKQYIPPQPTW